MNIHYKIRKHFVDQSYKMMIAMICIKKKIKVDFLAKFKLLIATERE